VFESSTTSLRAKFSMLALNFAPGVDSVQYKMNGTDLVSATFNAVNDVGADWTSAMQLHFENSFQ